MASNDEHSRPEYHEGPEAAHRFEGTMKRVLTVSKEELDKREAAYKKARRGKKTRDTKARAR